MKKKLYYAVDKSGQGCLFSDMPEREEKMGVWLGRIEPSCTMFVINLEAEGFRLPVLSWKDSPRVITLTLEVGNGKE